MDKAMLKRFSVLIAIFLLCLPFLSPRQASAVVDAAALTKAMQSIAVITVETTKGTRVSGLSFLSAGENRAVTALKLLKDAKKVSVKFQNGEEIVSPGLVDSDGKRGIAILDLTAPGKAALNLVPVKITPGTTVNCGAVRDGAYGFVQLSVAEIHQGADGVERYVLSGESPEGNGGGPALDPKGNVIGIILEETVSGSIRRTLVPSTFILALKSSLATREWTSMDKQQAAEQPAASASVSGSKDEIDPSLLDFLLLLSDHQATYAWADEVTRGVGFKQGVPQLVYDYQTKLNLGIRQIKTLKTDDPLRENLLRSFAEIGANQLSAAEFFISAVVAGQQTNDWGAQPQDLHKRSKASMTMATELSKASIPELRELYGKSSFFKETMPRDLVYTMGIEKRPSIFRLGVQTYARNPFAMLVVYEGSFASTIGLKPGDVIVSAAGETFETSGSIEDFKLVVQNNLGKTIETTVVRNNQNTTLKMEIPGEIPPDFLY